MDWRHADDRRRFRAQGFRVVHRQILAMDLLRIGRAAKAWFKLGNEDRVRPKRLDLISERFVQALNDRHHENHRDDADAHTKNRQRRAQLVAAQRVERHQG